MKTPQPTASADAIKFCHSQDLKSALVVHKEPVTYLPEFRIIRLLFKAFKWEWSSAVKLVRFGRVSNIWIKEIWRRMEKYRNTVTSRKNVKSNSPNLIEMDSFCEKSNNKSSVMICSPSTRFTRCSNRYAVLFSWNKIKISVLWWSGDFQ